MTKSLLVVVGLAVVGATASAHAQSGYERLWPDGPAQVRSYGGPLVPAYEVATIVRSIGLEPLAPPIRRLATYVVWATDQTGMRVRVTIDARYGDVLGVRPAVAWRNQPAGAHAVGPDGRGYVPRSDQPIYRTARVPDARVPLPRDRMALAAPMPRPRPVATGTDAPRDAAPKSVALPVQPTMPVKKDVNAKASDPAMQPAATQPGAQPDKADMSKEVAKAATGDEVTGSVVVPVANQTASTKAMDLGKEAKAVAGVSSTDLLKASGSAVSGEATAKTEHRTEGKLEN